MILYDYQCSICFNIQEEIISKGDPTPTCNICGALCEQLFSNPTKKHNVKLNELMAKGNIAYTRMKNVNPNDRGRI